MSRIFINILKLFANIILTLYTSNHFIFIYQGAKSPKNISGDQQQQQEQQQHIESTEKLLPNTNDLDSTFNENQPNPLKNVLPDIINNTQLKIINSTGKFEIGLFDFVWI